MKYSRFSALRFSWNRIYRQYYKFSSYFVRNRSESFNLTPWLLGISISWNFSRCESDEKLPVYRRDEVQRHKTYEKGIWVIFNGNVYDITSFVVNHPGGTEKVMLAAGTDVEPFWNIYRQHYNSPLPLQMLEQLKIGSLHPEDLRKETVADSSDPYAKDPVLSSIYLQHQHKPINAEPARAILGDNWITPTYSWFIRNHHPVPIIDASQHEVSVIVPGLKEEKLHFSNLKSKFEKTDIIASLQCGGNRRQEMNAFGKTAGTPW